ncbi:Rhomboid family protein [Neorhodopirellula lusitana]|uniref:Rhomboid family protein n=1 Tax=Neorhodopirellula lusitana TaxID=445327 RepID=A0ABY1PWW8_9BACT|nr:rhomboid family intramembrane serine protease [Neorhodopirellula lusitana]SMP48416.1 Rhomboid family protein [Neorhodopirellula lusitana]
MFFFPYSTDAPIYYWPVATVTLIVLSVLAFCGTFLQVFAGTLDLDQVVGWTLTFEAIEPLQWITHSFLHINPFDLVINMLFLWSFGMVIEGKVGPWWFLAIYFGTHLICAALAQTLFVSLSGWFPTGDELQVVSEVRAGGEMPGMVNVAENETWKVVKEVGAAGKNNAVGTSNAIFALLAMALIWAPENEMSCLLLVIVPRIGKMGVAMTAELKISILAMAFLFIEMVMFFFLGTLIWQAGFHLLSMLMGAGLALIMLRLNWVDCEDWDIVSRNEWLQSFPLLCSESHRLHLSQREDVKHDPIAAALAGSSSQLTSNSAYMAARSGSLAETSKGKKASQRAGAVPATGRDGAKAGGPDPRQQQAQSHPEFNRLSMLIRQAIGQESLVMADVHFSKLKESEIAIGLSDKTLSEYVSLLMANQQWIPALAPLQLMVAHGGPMAMEARLRIAQIQLKVLHQPGEAVKTLGRVQFASPKSGKQLSDAQQKLLARRDALLQQCGVSPPPLVAQRPAPK